MSKLDPIGDTVKALIANPQGSNSGQEQIAVVGSWAMGSAAADNGQKGLAVSIVPLNATPFVLVFPEHILKDFSKHFRDGVEHCRQGKVGPVHPPEIIEGRSH